MWKVLVALLFLPLAASATGMTPVAKATGFCATNLETYCYEWHLTSSAGIRFVAHGDEDTIEYSFYVSEAGGYRKLADVFPVLEDPSRPGRLFWGYPWDISDIRLTSVKGKPALLSTVRHTFKVTDEYDTPVSDEVRPAIVFTGRTTQPEFDVEPLHFEPLTLCRLGHDG